jgi:glycosyltransferase involved in cell wall biosynthesis
LINNTPLVSICCITYNHEKYIKDALEGFLAQKTDFPLEIVIGEDNSTDGTKLVLQDYKIRNPELFNVHCREQNIGVVPNFSATIRACKGKYIALCEGDDYWTDPLKLQKQVDFLEKHPECNICFHETLAVYGDSSVEQATRTNHKGNTIFNYRDLYRNCMIQTCSVVFQNQNLDDYLENSAGLRIGDWPLFAYLAQSGDIGFLDEVMSVYRIHDQGLWNSFGKQGALEVQAEALEFFNDSNLFKKSLELYDSLFMFYYKLALFHHQHQNNDRAVQYLGKCFTLLKQTSPRKIRFFTSLYAQLNLPKIYSFRDRHR